MKEITIIGCIIISGFVLFIWFIRLTRPDHKRKNMKLVHHRKDDCQLTLFV